MPPVRVSCGRISSPAVRQASNEHWEYGTSRSQLVASGKSDPQLMCLDLGFHRVCIGFSYGFIIFPLSEWHSFWGKPSDSSAIPEVPGGSPPARSLCRSPQRHGGVFVERPARLGGAVYSWALHLSDIYIYNYIYIHIM